MPLHRSRFAGAIAAARLLEDDFDDVEDVFDLMDQPQPIQGPPLTGFYTRWRDKMDGPRLNLKQHVRGMFNRDSGASHTYLFLRPDQSLHFVYYDTTIMTVQPDNTTTINFGDWPSTGTVIRLNDMLPDGFSLDRRYKMGPGRVWTSKKTGQPVQAGQTDERIYWRVRETSGYTDPRVQRIQAASSGDVIEPDGTLRAQKPPHLKQIRRAQPKPTYSPPPDDAPVG